MSQEKATYLSIFRSNKRILIQFAVIGFVLAFIVSLTHPLQYRSQASFLVIPNPGMNIDGYQASKAAEKYVLTLSSVVQSMSFYSKVISKNPSLSSLFPKEENNQRKQWKRDVEAKTTAETGILYLSVYGKTPENAQSILTTGIRVLEEEGPAYLGGNSSVLIYLIDTPLASSLPVRPNYPLNLLGGIAAGLLVGAVIAFVKTEPLSEEEQIEEPEPMFVQSVVEEPRSKPARKERDNYQVQNDIQSPIPPIESQAPWITVAHRDRR